ncbi:MAG TPA: hypothetical protein VMB34_29870 [Acetobacteraceae bacterium]|nr:hypothetical protein [Acetobacteraceae bacterium]
MSANRRPGFKTATPLGFAHSSIALIPMGLFASAIPGYTGATARQTPSGE